MKPFTGLLFLLAASVAHGQWNGDPAINNPVFATAAHNSTALAVPDGQGGSIVFSCSDHDNIYAKHINANGIKSWGGNGAGIAICDASGRQDDYYAVADGSGGAFISWADYRGNATPDIYLQHIDASGNLLSVANGLALMNTPGVSESEPFMCSDSNGAVIVGWLTDNGSSSIQLFARRYNSNCTAAWANAVQLSTAAGFRRGKNIVADGSGGAIFFFSDSRSDANPSNYALFAADDLTNMDIYSQRLNASGTRLWGNAGMAVCTAAGNQDAHHNAYAVADGSGGAVIAFDDYRSNVPDAYGDATNINIYMQRMNAAGAALWTNSAIPLTTEPGNQNIKAFAAGDGLFIAAFENRAGSRLYAQAVNLQGQLQWGAAAVAVSSAAVQAFDPKLAVLANNVVIIGFEEPAAEKIVAQKLNASGSLQWGAGVNICSTPGFAPTGIQATAAADTAVLFFWQDLRNAAGNGTDVFASKLRGDGTLENAAGDVSVVNGFWNNPGTWARAAVPLPGAMVDIRHIVLLNTNASVRALTIEAPGNLTVQSGRQLFLQQ